MPNRALARHFARRHDRVFGSDETWSTALRSSARRAPVERVHIIDEPLQCEMSSRSERTGLSESPAELGVVHETSKRLRKTPLVRRLVEKTCHSVLDDARHPPDARRYDREARRLSLDGRDRGSLVVRGDD